MRPRIETRRCVLRGDSLSKTNENRIAEALAVPQTSPVEKGQIMFTIRHSDLTESQPSDLETIRRWVSEGRIGLETPVRKEGESSWKSLGDFPELRAPISSKPPGTPPPLQSSDSGSVPSQPLRTHKLAIASLVLGILALPTLGLGGLAGVICGAVALSQIRKNRTELKGEGIAIAGLVISGFFLLIVPVAVMAGLLLPALAKAKQRAQSIQCVNNMKQVALGLRIYSNDHKDTFPPDLKSIRNEISVTKVLICPGDSARSTELKWEEVSADTVSYEYLTPGIDESKTTPQTVILRCPVHGSEAHADGSVIMRGRR